MPWLGALALSMPAHAQTPAGTTIANVATLAFDTSGRAQSLTSNTVTLTTAELLDVAIAADRADQAVTDGRAAVGFVVTNQGNGDEAFGLTFAGGPVAEVAIDTDGDGRYDPAVDRALAAGAALTLTPGGHIRFFALLDGASIFDNARLTATATALIGAGAPGHVFAGVGDRGGDAIVGRTGASATATTLLVRGDGQPGLVKSQHVLAPDGSDRPVRGAIVTYRLLATLPAGARGVTVDDRIPAGTDYLPGSLMLDGGPLSDADDGDAGRAGGGGAHVALGDAGAAARHTIEFSVRIQ